LQFHKVDPSQSVIDIDSNPAYSFDAGLASADSRIAAHRVEAAMSHRFGISV
jgi:hypothetical protein